MAIQRKKLLWFAQSKNLVLISIKNGEILANIFFSWNRLISTTQAIMNKFVLKVGLKVFPAHSTFYDSEKFKQLMTLERHFTSAHITDLHTYEKYVKNPLVSVAERFGKSLINLTLEYWHIPSHIMFELMKQVPEVQKLTLICGRPRHCDDEKPFSDKFIGRLPLKKLKSLFVASDWNVFQHIKAPELLELNNRVSATNFDPNSFENFLKASTKLQSLMVDDIKIFANMSSEFPFKLTKHFSYSVSRGWLNENTKRFLLSQASTDTLEARHLDLKFHEFVLTYFKRLRFLNCNFERFQASQEFYKNLEPLPLLIEVISREGFSSETVQRSVFGKCLKLVSFHLHRYHW